MAGRDGDADGEFPPSAGAAGDVGLERGARTAAAAAAEAEAAAAAAERGRQQDRARAWEAEVEWRSALPARLEALAELATVDHTEEGAGREEEGQVEGGVCCSSSLGCLSGLFDRHTYIHEHAPFEIGAPFLFPW